MLSTLAGDDLDSIVDRMEQAVFASAQHMLQSFQLGRALGATRKRDDSVLTVLDLESQKIIKNILGTKILVIAEEDPETHTLTNEPEYYLVDPLDGTSACKRFPGVQGGQVGYGPLIGYSRNRLLIAATYINVPTRRMYTAVLGNGAFEIPLDQWAACSHLQDRKRLKIRYARALSECAAIFYPGTKGELQALEKIRKTTNIETAYRFGGFANDCTRIAQDLEQIQIQFSLKAWDLSAALIPAEAGLCVVVDPQGEATELANFKITPDCAVLISPQHLSERLLSAIR